MITIENLTKRRAGRLVLNDVGFRALPGRVIGFVGPNGAGKSSTLRCLLGLDRPDSGRALIDGRRYRDLPHPWRKVGAVLDSAGAQPSRSGRAHLRWAAAGAGVPGRRVDEVLEMVGLSHAARRPVRTYSLGMGQRLGLATALLGDPDILILDEPINGLDPDGIRWIRRLMRSHAAQGGTVLVSSHVLSELAEIADDIVIIADGTIRAGETLTGLIERYADLEQAYIQLTRGVSASPGRPAPSATGAAR